MLEGLQPSPITAPLSIYWAKLPAGAQTWERLSTGGVRQTALGGDHYSVMRPPRLSRVLDELVNC